jgi:hypothetical protein
MRLICDALAHGHPHPRFIEALSRRDDPEFICFVLRWIPERLTGAQQKNLSLVTSVAWLDPSGPAIERLPEGLHAGLARFVSAIGVTAERKLAVQEWLVRHGSPEGRLAAAGVLADLDEAEVQAIVQESLVCNDAAVQAWATSQLRAHGGSEAIGLLIERLDSPLEEVRAAARDELRGLDIDRMLELHEHLDPVVGRRVGELLKKIDPELPAKLAAELAGPVRRRRIEVIRAAQKLGLHDLVGEPLARTLGDEDPLVRRTAIEALASIPSPAIDELLLRAAHDPSPRVREAAARAVARRGGSKPVAATSRAVEEALP